MQFTDIIFAVFMGVFFCIYWFALRKNLRLQNIWLLCASYVFYGWWDWTFLILIIITSLSTYGSAILYERYRHKCLILGNIILNIGILVVFKYFNFFSLNLARLFGLFGIGLDWFTLDVLLPVGISFYTFQAIGYSIDVMRGNVRPTRDLIGFFTFIAFFPQLVAGPIESARTLLPQILRKREWNSQQAVDGMRMILFGLLKKLCVADMLALYVDEIFAMPHLSPEKILTGGILFTFQLYCDFSSYSEIARGCASLLGIRLMVNFRFPLFSRNIIEFWQRWHISLMLWFKNYVYIPLGGNRMGKWHTIANYSVVFLLSGLWHGAAWNFVLWGLYWAVCYVAGRFLLNLDRHPEGRISLHDLPNILLTFGVVSFGFYIFRSPAGHLLRDLSSIWSYPLVFGALWAMTKTASILLRNCKYKKSIAAISAITLIFLALWRSGIDVYTLNLWWLIAAFTVIAIEWIDRNHDYPFVSTPRNRVLRMSLYWFIGTLIVLSEPTEMTFIYFQF